MNLSEYVIGALLLWIIREIIVISWTSLLTRPFDHTLRVEKTTRRFAEARNRLMELVLEGEISPDSYTFQSFYRINTFVMRRPDQYPEISQLLVSVLLQQGEVNTENPLLRESKEWSEEVKEVVMHTAEAIGNLIIDYSLLLRLIVEMEKKFKAISAFVWILNRAKQFVQNQEKSNPDISSIWKAQQALYKAAA